MHSYIYLYVYANMFEWKCENIDWCEQKFIEIIVFIGVFLLPYHLTSQSQVQICKAQMQTCNTYIYIYICNFVVYKILCICNEHL